MSLTTHHITSHSTEFPSLARVPAQNFSNFEQIYCTRCYVYVRFHWPYYYETFTCVTYSKSETLNGPGPQVYHVTRFPIRLMNWPLCWHTIPERRVICDNFAHFKFIIFMCIVFLFITLISDDFLSWVTLQVGDDDCFYYHCWRNNVVIAFGTLSSFLT